MSRFTRIGVLAAVGVLSIAPGVASAQIQETATPTFARDVMPILQRSCQHCHRAGEIAPMSLMTYEEVRPWARSIRARVSSREMPPWHVDRTVGIQQFKDDPSLSDEEISTLVSWIDGGAPLGNPSDMPPARQFADGNAWQIGTPDVIVKYPKKLVPAEGADMFGMLFAEIPITESRYIKAIQTRSATQASHRVVHHANSDAVPQELATEELGRFGGQFLVEYASGKNAEVYPEGSGVLINPGEIARLNYHFHSVGEAIDAEVEVGMVLYPAGYTPKYIRWSKQLSHATQPLDVPPGEVARSDGYVVLHKPARIIAFQPHMHNLGVRQCLEFIYPTQGASSKTEVVSCANFNNNWHLVYNYADDSAPLVPAGTILHNMQWHDNSATNPRALDPSNWVGDGGRTIDEMGFFWIGWIELSEEEYQQQLSERQARRAATTQQQQQQ